ncbi:MAG: NADPH:quinone oxidoreductase family protein [Pseudomonadota bacterium]
MKAIVVSERGGPEVFKVREVDVPEPAARQARIKMQAASLNYSDIQIAGDFYPGHIDKRLPYIAGREGAGIVDAVGEEVTDIRPGDRVMALGLRGAFAEYALAIPNILVPISDQMSFTQAAGLQLPHLTAVAAMEVCGQLKAGDCLLVHAAASSVGQAVVRLAKHIGATVVATASNQDKLDAVAALGADHCINYVTDDFEEKVRDIVKQGVDVALDTVGGEVLEKTLRVMRPYGRLVIAGNASNTPVTFSHYELLSTYRCALVTLELGTMIIQRPDLMTEVRRRFKMLLDEGVFVMAEPNVYPLESGPQALQAMAGLF